MIQSRLTRSGRRIVTISQDQVDSLAGNCYEVIGEDGRNKIIISTRSVRHPRVLESLVASKSYSLQCYPQSMVKSKH